MYPPEVEATACIVNGTSSGSLKHRGRLFSRSHIGDEASNMKGSPVRFRLAILAQCLGRVPIAGTDNCDDLGLEAGLGIVIRACRPPLSKGGVAVDTRR